MCDIQIRHQEQSNSKFIEIPNLLTKEETFKAKSEVTGATQTK
jgi:hypothetical protein